MDLTCHSYEHRDVGVIGVSGEIDLATAPRLREQLVRLVTEHAGRIVVVDLSGVTFCDSLGLGVLVGAQRRARALGGELRLVVPGGRLADAFSMPGLDAVLPSFADVDAAAS